MPTPLHTIEISATGSGWSQKTTISAATIDQAFDQAMRFLKATRFTARKAARENPPLPFREPKQQRAERQPGDSANSTHAEAHGDKPTSPASQTLEQERIHEQAMTATRNLELTFPPADTNNPPPPPQVTRLTANSWLDADPPAVKTTPPPLPEHATAGAPRSDDDALEMPAFLRRAVTTQTSDTPKPSTQAQRSVEPTIDHLSNEIEAQIKAAKDRLTLGEILLTNEAYLRLIQHKAPEKHATLVDLANTTSLRLRQSDDPSNPSQTAETSDAA